MFGSVELSGAVTCLMEVKATTAMQIEVVL